LGLNPLGIFYVSGQGEILQHHTHKGRQVVGFVDNTTPETIQDQMGSPGTRSSCQLAVSPVIRHQSLQG
jgi:hypothetical protein